MSPIYNYINKFEDGYKCLGISILLASITCVFSAICSFVLAPMDKRRERVIKQSQIKNSTQNTETIKLTDAIHFPVQLWLIIVICVVL